MRRIAALWHRLFLAERPSISLSIFRWFVALTVGCHMIPSFLQLRDNYLSTAFKTQNASFFPLPILRLVAAGPDRCVFAMVGVFYIAWGCFTVGFWSQASCIMMTLACYYFYALNNLHIGTLSFDILLVTLFLMCLTPYHGDSCSLDAILRERRLVSARMRPFFMQRLLQLQISGTYFYTALHKVTAGGNWLTDNPLYYLVNSPPGGVVREFWGRGWLAHQPHLCYAIGIITLTMEFALAILWFVPRARWAAILTGWMFHVLLLVTLHVPTIFFVLFPAQMALFIPPESIAAWCARRRRTIKNPVARAPQG